MITKASYNKLSLVCNQLDAGPNEQISGNIPGVQNKLLMELGEGVNNSSLISSDTRFLYGGNYHQILNLWLEYSLSIKMVYRNKNYVRWFQSKSSSIMKLIYSCLFQYNLYIIACAAVLKKNVLVNNSAVCPFFEYHSFYKINKLPFSKSIFILILLELLDFIFWAI